MGSPYSIRQHVFTRISLRPDVGLVLGRELRSRRALRGYGPAFRGSRTLSQPGWAKLLDGSWQITTQPQGRLNKFFHLLEDEYKKAVASGVPVVNTVKKTGPPTRLQATPAINPRPLRRLCMVAGAAALGALAGSFWRRRS